jgi:hypothetical protein
MTIDPQLETLQVQAAWVLREKRRLLRVINACAREQQKAFRALLEINDRTLQLDRDFEKFYRS